MTDDIDLLDTLHHRMQTKTEAMEDRKMGLCINVEKWKTVVAVAGKITER